MDLPTLEASLPPVSLDKDSVLEMVFALMPSPADPTLTAEMHPTPEAVAPTMDLLNAPTVKSEALANLVMSTTSLPLVEALMEEKEVDKSTARLPLVVVLMNAITTTTAMTLREPTACLTDSAWIAEMIKIAKLEMPGEEMTSERLFATSTPRDASLLATATTIAREVLLTA